MHESTDERRGWQPFPSRFEAEREARECERTAEWYERHNRPEAAAEQREEAERLRNPAAHLPVGTRLLRGEDGAWEVGDDRRLHRLDTAKETRERMRLVDEAECFSSLSEPQQRAYEALGRIRERQASRCLPHGPAIVRRTPAARPAARRPRTSAKRSTSRAGPDDDSGESEPPAGVVGGTKREPRRAWRAGTWTRWRCCPECSAVLEYVAGALWCPRAACPLHDVRHPPADPGGGR